MGSGRVWESGAFPPGHRSPRPSVMCSSHPPPLVSCKARSPPGCHALPPAGPLHLAGSRGPLLVSCSMLLHGLQVLRRGFWVETKALSTSHPTSWDWEVRQGHFLCVSAGHRGVLEKQALDLRAGSDRPQGVQGCGQSARGWLPKLLEDGIP